MIRRVSIKFCPFGNQGKVKIIGASGKEVSFKKILGMKLLMLGVKQKEEDIEVFLELEK